MKVQTKKEFCKNTTPKVEKGTDWIVEGQVYKGSGGYRLGVKVATEGYKRTLLQIDSSLVLRIDDVFSQNEYTKVNATFVLED